MSSGIMASRKELGSIASGLACSFNSRNNDVDGYWALGKLYKFVDAAERKSVCAELISGCIQPETHEFDAMLSSYKERLLGYIGNRSIPFHWVVSARILVEFEARFDPKHHACAQSMGRPCIVKCDIEDDHGRHHVAYAYSNCWPHNALKETRSCRAGSF